jgi:hypothetical protein
MIYDFRCKTCGVIREDVVLPIRHTVDERPKCCGATMPMYFSTFPMVQFKAYELEGGGFVAHGIEGRPVITSLKQRKELMARHDLVDANDFGPPPDKMADVKHYHEVIKPSIDAITPSNEVLREMKDRGLADII